MGKKDFKKGRYANAGSLQSDQEEYWETSNPKAPSREPSDNDSDDSDGDDGDDDGDDDNGNHDRKRSDGTLSHDGPIESFSGLGHSMLSASPVSSSHPSYLKYDPELGDPTSLRNRQAYLPAALNIDRDRGSNLNRRSAQPRSNAASQHDDLDGSRDQPKPTRLPSDRKHSAAKASSARSAAPRDLAKQSVAAGYDAEDEAHAEVIQRQRRPMSASQAEPTEVSEPESAGLVRQQKRNPASQHRQSAQHEHREQAEEQVQFNASPKRGKSPSPQRSLLAKAHVQKPKSPVHGSQTGSDDPVYVARSRADQPKPFAANEDPDDDGYYGDRDSRDVSTTVAGGTNIPRYPSHDADLDDSPGLNPSASETLKPRKPALTARQKRTGDSTSSPARPASANQVRKKKRIVGKNHGHQDIDSSMRKLAQKIEKTSIVASPGRGNTRTLAHSSNLAPSPLDGLAVGHNDISNDEENRFKDIPADILC
ncbi:uncharacterized protein BJ171DRAFT_190592 [Polychytrium aggregatum]|uniref:uncharacterized protein n=1 Tax=Polychytrium aggregatum TaxID=110093 RepID=UPI0022FF0106|nr:uncharacterized protein BJ171DRAFT_190592 [Polychytrium aggregatum]KAI9202066.1 hypothetical protein BJ171DRAFT_190592 [Polychytrium aggregatum]